MLCDRNGRVWAMRPDEMMIAQVVAEREAAECYVGGAELEGSDFARVQNGVAVIPVRGLLMRQASGWFWSYEEVQRDVALAQADPAVSAIVLDIDSGGGMVSGCEDCAAEIRASGPKPVHAFVGGTAASAAYWLASAADSITLGSGAVVGSIGAVIEYVDLEPIFEKIGARVVRVVSQQSPNKRLDPGSDEGRAEMQAIVDAAGQAFVSAVAEFRGVTPETVLADFGQGLIFDRAEALKRGMADASGTLTGLISALSAGHDIGRATARINGAGLAARADATAEPAAAAQETPMEWENLSLAQLREHRADLVSGIEAAARATAEAERDTAVAEAVTAERARMAAIDEIAVEGHEDLTATAKSEGWSAERLALEMVKADKAAGGRHIADLRAADAGAAVTPIRPQETAGAAADASPEEKARAAWDKDASLRAEFKGNFEAYKAFSLNAAAGRVHILGAR